MHRTLSNLLFVLLFFQTCGLPRLEIQLRTFDETKLPTLNFLQISSVESDSLLQHPQKPLQKMLNEPLSELDCLADLQEQNAVSFKGRLPFIYLEGFIQNKLSWVGRFPLAQACNTLTASISLSPPNAFVEWKLPSLDQAKLNRVGHQITTLPDGGLWIHGGVDKVHFPTSQENVLPLLVDTFHSKTWVFNPKDNAFRRDLDLPNGLAFHSSHFSSEEILTLGGLHHQKNTTQSKYLKRFHWQENQAITPNASNSAESSQSFQRVFHQSISIKSPNENSPSGILIPLGGLCLNVDQNSRSNECGQVFLSHQTIWLQEHQSVLIIGGQFYNPEQHTYSTSPWIWEIPISQITKGNLLLDQQKRFSMQSPRAGHTAIQMNPNQILVFGGFRVSEGSPLQKQPFHPEQVFDDGELLERDQNGNWISQKMNWNRRPQIVQPRTFHSAHLLSGKRILLYGGISSTLDSDALNTHALLLSWDSTNGQTRFCGRQIEQKTKRFWHTATTLSTGQILFSGGLHRRTSETIQEGKTIEWWNSIHHLEIFNPSLQTTSSCSP